MADISGTYDPNAEAQSSFDPVPLGEYRAKIIEVMLKTFPRPTTKAAV